MGEREEDESRRSTYWEGPRRAPVILWVANVPILFWARAFPLWDMRASRSARMSHLDWFRLSANGRG